MNRRRSSHRWTVVIAATCCCAAVTVRGRSDPPASKTSNLITVRGCLNGRVLTATDRSGMTDSIRRFDLTGSKEMTKLLKEHSGHMEEVTGTLKELSPAGPIVKEKTMGKNRFYVGAGKTEAPPPDTAKPSIAVRDLTHLAGQCTS